MFRPRVLLASGIALLTLAGACAAALSLMYGERIAYVLVRWAPVVDPATQEQVERAHGLRRVDFQGGRTWGYILTDLSRDNISSLTDNVAVEDTHHIERDTSRIASTAPRGDYPTTRPAWIARGLELLRGPFLGAGALLFALGMFTAWRDARRQTTGVGTRSSTLRVARGGFRAASVLFFGGGVAAMAIYVGTRDLESFETAFFSLDRGTAATAVRVLGQPVYTTALGLGVRLPLHGNLGASPGAALAPYLPAPLTYWLLLAFSIAASAMVVRHALEPICGRAVSWLALVFLFCSAPTVNYTLYDDWPETAVTYFAFVACVFAPHALLASVGAATPLTIRRLAVLSIAGTLWGLIALSHPGYWPLLAATLVLASALLFLRPDGRFEHKLTTVAVLAIASLLPVALQAPDIIRELTAGEGTMQRFLQGPAGSLLPANAFPFLPPESRVPFTNLALAIVSLLIGLLSNDPLLRRLAVGGGLLSISLGVGAATLPPAPSRYAPSTTWALRDPAIAFAVLSGATAVAAVRTSPTVAATVGVRAGIGVLLLAALQGLAYAGRLVAIEFRPAGQGQRSPWTHDMRPEEVRAGMRGLGPDRLTPGERLAFWPGLRDEMRDRHRASTDFADAGYRVVTASTKDRTMSGLVEPNTWLFNQATDLPPQILCDVDVVRFLQLRYLLSPPGVECQPWTRLPELQVDGWIDVRPTTQSDDRARALPLSSAAAPMARRPALSASSSLLSELRPLPGTSVRVTARGAAVELDDPSRVDGHALVLPLAYDPALRASSGQVVNVGGLAALTEVDERHVTVEFVPDLAALLRAGSMTLAQLLALVGFAGMARVAWALPDRTFALRTGGVRGAIARAGPAVRRLLDRRNLLYVAYTLAVVQGPNVVGGLLLPTTVFAVTRLTHRERWQGWLGGSLLAVALVRVAAAGSRAPNALHDPLFWGLMSALALGVASVTGRRPAATSTASALGGACAAIATLLSVVPELESGFPPANVTTFWHSFVAISGEFGVLATVFLLGVWLQAIALRGSPSRNVERMHPAVRGALLAALLLALLGVVPASGIDRGWIVILGLLLGLAEAKARQQPATRQ